MVLGWAGVGGGGDGGLVGHDQEMERREAEGAGCQGLRAVPVLQTAHADNEATGMVSGSSWARALLSHACTTAPRSTPFPLYISFLLNPLTNLGPSCSNHPWAQKP